jgi:hypothetical protein
MDTTERDAEAAGERRFMDLTDGVVLAALACLALIAPHARGAASGNWGIQELVERPFDFVGAVFLLPFSIPGFAIACWALLGMYVISLISRPLRRAVRSRSVE